MPDLIRISVLDSGQRTALVRLCRNDGIQGKLGGMNPRIGIHGCRFIASYQDLRLMTSPSFVQKEPAAFDFDNDRAAHPKRLLIQKSGQFEIRAHF